MRIGALIGAVSAFTLFIIWIELGIDEAITVQQAIMSGLMLATCLICISNIEK